MDESDTSDDVPIRPKLELRGKPAQPSRLGQRASSVAKSKTVSEPIKRPTVIWNKQTHEVDDQPLICKDWLETGYCTYGLACKFLHTRDKPVSTLDEERRRPSLPSIKRESEKTENLCPICHRDPEDPVRTRCGHVFCGRCAILRYKSDTTCFVCGKDTHGVFNSVNRK